VDEKYRILFILLPIYLLIYLCKISVWAFETQLLRKIRPRNSDSNATRNHPTLFNTINWFNYYTEVTTSRGHNYWECIEIKLQERGSADSDSRNPEPQIKTVNLLL
jgi:hypothetical protein